MCVCVCVRVRVRVRVLASTGQSSYHVGLCDHPPSATDGKAKRAALGRLFTDVAGP